MKNIITQAVTALSIAASACSSLSEEVLHQQEHPCDTATRRFTGTIGTLEEKVARAETLQIQNPSTAISNEILLTRNSILKTVEIFGEQEQTMEYACRNTRPSPGNISGTQNFSIRTASLRNRLQKLKLND